MKHLAIVAIVASMTAGVAGAQPIRAGVFDKKSVVVAFYRSPQWAEVMKAKFAERDAAKQANDTAKVKELEAWGAKSQELAHRQLAGEAPITNILETLAPAFPDIAKRAGVSLITAELAFAGPAVESVDVTEHVLTCLKADSRTLDMVHTMQKSNR